MIVQVVLPGTFGRDMFGLHVQQRLLGRLLEARRPRLAAKLGGLGLSMPFLSTQWFVSCWVNSVPRAAVLRLWDVMLLRAADSGEAASHVLLGAALAVLRECEKGHASGGGGLAGSPLAAAAARGGGGGSGEEASVLPLPLPPSPSTVGLLTVSDPASALRLVQVRSYLLSSFSVFY